MMAGTEAPDLAAGVLLVDKSAGPTSHDAVARAREVLGIRRIGHSGTLDPFATGLLLLCVGSATRLVEYLHLLPKSYEAVLRLGAETDTNDRTGEITDRSDAWREIGEERVRRVLEDHTGTLQQRPPAFSAVRVKGERAFRAAREGRPVDLPAREVRVDSLELLEMEPPEIRIAARVGTGTYIRALARDVGRDLGTGAHLRELRRTRIGSFAVSAAVPYDDLRPPPGFCASGSGAPEPEDPGDDGVSWWRSPAAALEWLPSRSLSGEEVERVGHGARIPRGRIRGAAPDGPTGPGDASPDRDERPVALLREGRLVAVGEVAGDRIQPRKVFQS